MNLTKNEAASNLIHPGYPKFLMLSFHSIYLPFRCSHAFSSACPFPPLLFLFLLVIEDPHNLADVYWMALQSQYDIQLAQAVLFAA